MEDKSLQRAALLATTLDSFMTPLMASAVAVAMPAIAREFGMTAVTLGWMASAYLLAAAAFLLPFGRLADIHNKFYGVASSTLATMRMVGQMLSMGIATLVFSLLIGKVGIAPESYPLFLRSMRVSFLVFCALCCLGVFFSLARGRVR